MYPRGLGLSDRQRRGKMEERGDGVKFKSFVQAEKNGSNISYWSFAVGPKTETVHTSISSSDSFLFKYV